MKVLKYSITTKLIIKKHKRDVEIFFSVIKNIKKIKKTIFFIGPFPLIKVFQKVNKQYCKIRTFEYPNISQYNYPKISKIKPKKSYVFFHNVIRNKHNYWFKGYPYIALGLADPSSITTILPSEVQNLLNSYSSLVSFPFSIRVEVKLSVTDIFGPLNFILFMKKTF